MQYTTNHSFRLPEMSDPASIGDINFNTNKLDTLLLGSALTVGLYPTQVSASQIQSTDKISQALSKLEYKIDNTAAVSKLTGYTPPTSARPVPVAATDTINVAFAKLVTYIKALQTRVAALEQSAAGRS